MIRAYGYTSCTSCRKTVDMLRESGVRHEYRDYFLDRFSRDELVSILDEAGLTPRDVLSKRSKVYRARGPEIDALTEAELVDLMIEEPTLLRRPIVIGPGGVVVGHNAEALSRAIRSSRGQGQA